MALVRAEVVGTSGLILSRSGEISSSPPIIEIPVHSEMIRIIGEGRGIDLRYDLSALGLIPGIDGYRDYEVYTFERKVAEAVKNGERCTYYGPLINDLIFPSDQFSGDPRFPGAGEFAGLARWDFFKLVDDRLDEVIEDKTAREFREEYRDKRDKLPILMQRVQNDLSLRIKRVIAFTHVPSRININPSAVRIRFISTTPQTGKTNFERPMTPHETIEPTPEIRDALLRIEEIRRVSAIANKKEKARIASEGVLIQFPRSA